MQQMILTIYTLDYKGSEFLQFHVMSNNSYVSYIIIFCFKNIPAN